MASTLRKWGYVTVNKVKKENVSQREHGIGNRTYVLGLCKQEYVCSMESVGAAVGQLLAARSAVHEEWVELLQRSTDALSIVRKLQVIFRKANKAAPMLFPNDDKGYVMMSVGRKIIIALLASGRASVDWASMSRPELEELCCDQNEFLKVLPKTWSAADISNFIFGRPDWGIFVSVFACLMKDVFKITSCSRETLIERLASPIFERAAAELRTTSGHAVHPTIVMNRLLSSAP